MDKTIHSPAYAELIGWLKKAREAKGLTMRQLAVEMNVPHSWIGKVEQMERRLDVLEYVRFCAVLGVDPGKGIKILKQDI